MRNIRSIRYGSVVPTDLEVDGALVILTDGRRYLMIAGVWTLLPASSGGPSLEPYRIISSFPATIASGDTCFEVTASGTLALPTPTSGRKLIFKVVGATLTLTRSSSGVEDYTGSMANSTILVPGESVAFRGNGSVWRRFAA
jgi:hypothetical protein